jgi:hypothetical protein
MSQVHEFSDEFINAFVDNQVTPEEKARVYAHLASSEAFNRRVCELRKIRDLIRLAYQELSIPARDRVTHSTKVAGYKDHYI